jgi:hypothetical protein
VKLKTAPERLALLLPWINSDALVEAARVLGDVEAFVESFDGSQAAGYVEVARGDLDGIPDFVQKEMSEASPPTAEELDDLRVQLRLLMEQGFGDQAQLATGAGSSLRFAVRSGGERSKPGWRQTSGGNRVREGGVGAMERYQAPGAYVLQVYGSLLDVVPFLVMHLLTQPQMVSVRRCLACGRFRVLQTGARGAPPKHCGKACRDLSYAMRRKEEQERAEARKQKRRSR